jgi:hypothetical protein
LDGDQRRKSYIEDGRNMVEGDGNQKENSSQKNLLMDSESTE